MKDIKKCYRKFLIKDKWDIWKTTISAVIGWFVGFILESIVLEKFLEVKTTSKTIYINRPGKQWDLVIYYFILVIMLMLLFYIFYRSFRKQKHKLKKLITIFIGVIIITGSILLYPIGVRPVARVDFKAEITGWVKDLNSYNYLFVRPIDSAQCWLQQPAPLQLDNYGQWRTVAYFGGDSGTKFEIIILTSSTKLHQYTKLGSYDCNIISNHLEKFVRVVMHR